MFPILNPPPSSLPIPSSGSSISLYILCDIFWLPDSISVFYIKVLYQSSQSLTQIPIPVLLFSHRVYLLIHFTINLLISVSILYCNINSMLARNSALFYLLSYPQFLEHSRSPVIYVEYINEWRNKNARDGTAFWAAEHYKNTDSITPDQLFKILWETTRSVYLISVKFIGRKKSVRREERKSRKEQMGDLNSRMYWVGQKFIWIFL